ncbi:MAG: Unknown protein [uncultured Sulfurovum sp.]|uniref:Paraquat-inducible protein A n=1 Tax=uncultured Sulfurovum sp. TaxID=269237 RepID=A0A6S6TVY6_9BACT|nr:MAG: Unknown protein [uncultured Sulfurovum sp.]
MKILKVLLAIISVLLLLLLMYFSMELIKTGKEAKSYKTDYAKLHSVEYGMFNSDLWTNKMTQVISNKIDNFDLNINNRDEIEGYVSTIIDTLIVETERIVKERNKGENGFFDNIMGSTKQMITDSIIDFKALRQRVPQFTSAVMLEIERPENQARAKKVLSEKLKEFMKKKFQATTDMTGYNALLYKYNASNLKACTLILDTHIQSNTQTMNSATINILLLAFTILILVVLQGTLNSVGLFTLAGTTLNLLFAGVMLPMLDIEAKITKLYFIVFEQPIIFENQILFFQSKSIYDLFRLLLESGEAKMILVGVLLVTFSIIFPLLKLIATTIYFYAKGILQNNIIIRFFALQSTKWSMADVMVVSIFMAYLGLDGVVGSELNKLQTQGTPINIITFNGTHLEVGFYLFLGFVLTSFVLSILVKNSKESRNS